MNIFYGDASGFSLDPSIPYGWQPKGKYTKIVPCKGKRLNVFGLLSRNNELEACYTTGTICSDFVVQMLDGFCEKITQPTVVVIDNASIHHSKKFKAKIQEWQEKDLYIFYLPTYSPHLNLIETLWRKIKYEWLKHTDYENFDTLTTAVENILLKVGTDININFNELAHFTQFKLSIIK